MTYRELRTKLETLGCRFRRQADGSHEMWVNPANGRRAIIPKHGNRDLATGTLHQIRRDLGTSEQVKACADQPVIPAKAGIQKIPARYKLGRGKVPVDSGLRRNDDYSEVS